MGTMQPERQRKGKKKGPVADAQVSASADRYGLIADFFAEGSSRSVSQNQRSIRSWQVRQHRTVGHSLYSRIKPQTFEESWEGQGSRQAQRAAQGAGGFGKARGTAAAEAAAEAEGEISEAEVRSEGEASSSVVVHSYEHYINKIVQEAVVRMTNGPHSRGRPPLIAPGELWISQPKTMPDELTSLAIPEAVKIVLNNCSTDYLESMSFQQYVHQSPGTHVPKDIAFQLSLGARYMFHQPTNAELIGKSWHDFERRLRWRIKFMFEGDRTEAYDPDYDVRDPSKVAPPKLPHYIELGLTKGRIFVDKAMSKVPVSTDNAGSTTYNPRVKAVQQFLTSNEYVVTGTDKNLGLAVSRRDWIIEKSQDILNNNNDYRLIELDEAVQILNQKCDEMWELSKFAAYRPSTLGKQISEFLRSKCTLRGKTHHIPKFYGIPKIHKVPTKMRPIIPCHSAIMNPAAKFVSKILKPIVESAPTIIHGTKDLAQKLSKLKIDRNRKWYLVTGDVVAFYPNIPLEKCMQIIYELYFEHYWNPRADRHEPYNEALQQFFYKCLKTGNTQLLTQFQGRIYQQLRGLAMGVADSPDLANLFGYYYERKAGVLDHPDIFYYGRYIDDCLAIVYAEDNQSAINLLKSLIQFDSCVIEWANPGSSQPFLDMLLYQDGHNDLQYAPYRKAGNHQERIPWISGHPYDVKRGTFLGEMSRLATLSSTLEHYLEALRGLVALYIHRGYPAAEVHKWLYGNMQVRWDNKLAVRQPATDAETLVLKTEYNLAWNYFNAHELGQTIFNYWREWINRSNTGNFDKEYPPPPIDEANTLDDMDLSKTNIFNSRVIVSRKRTRNFMDLTNLWKKTVLETLEDSALDDYSLAAATYGATKRAFDYDINTQVVGRRAKRTRRANYDGHYSDSDEDIESSEHTGNLWASGSMGVWGRGAKA